MLLNRKHVKEFALKCAAEERPAAGFSRVSASFYTKIDARIREIIRKEVAAMPSVGVTIK